jgi:hypothetical protein
MRSIKTMVSVIVLGFSFMANAQDTEISNESTADKVDKRSYYQKRAEEDAKYEQQFSAGTKAEEEAFWEEQKDYEDDLKRKDKKAYRAYMKGKKAAYAEHYGHCDHHCHHSDHYYHHASFYYYRYNGHYYERSPSSRSTIGTNVRVGTPSVRLGLF